MMKSRERRLSLMAERNMCNVAMRDIVVLPGSRAHHAQRRGGFQRPGRIQIESMLKNETYTGTRYYNRTTAASEVNRDVAGSEAHSTTIETARLPRRRGRELGRASEFPPTGCQVLSLVDNKIAVPSGLCFQQNTSKSRTQSPRS